MNAKILLSIKPKYVELIMALKKTVEFRRVLPNGLSYGDIVVLYESAPTSAIVGQMMVFGVYKDWPKEKLWQKFKKEAGLSKEEYDKYFQGKETASAFRVMACRRYERPLTLAKAFPFIKRVPQNFCFISRVSRDYAWERFREALKNDKREGEE